MKDRFGNLLEIGDLVLYLRGSESPDFVIAKIVEFKKRTKVVQFYTYRGLNEWADPKESYMWVESQSRLVRFNHESVARMNKRVGME